MDKKKKVILLWVLILCVVGACNSTLEAQSVKSVQFCGVETHDDSGEISVFLKFLDDKGQRIPNLDLQSIKSYMRIFEDGNEIDWQDASISEVKSGQRIPEGYRFSVLIDLNIPEEGRLHVYEKALKKLVESAPDSSVYISFFGDYVSNSELITKGHYADFKDKFKQKASQKYFYSAVGAKLAEFSSKPVELENKLQLPNNYTKNDSFAKKATEHKGKNILLIFTECGTEPETEPLVDYATIVEYQRDAANDVPCVYAFYYTGNGNINEDVHLTLNGITQHERLPQNRRGGYFELNDLGKVLASISKTIEDQMYDFVFTYKALKDRYAGDTKFSAQWNNKFIDKADKLPIGSPERHWIPIKKMTTWEIVMLALMALLITLLTIAFFFLVMKVLIPWLKSRAFAANYYKKYVPEANVQRRVCHYCKQDLQPGQMIVTKCKHYMHIHCWKINNYKCSEYGQNCNVGIQEHVEWKTLFTKQTLRDCKQTIAGILAGLVSWIVYALTHDGRFMDALARPIVKTFYKASYQFANLTDLCVDKVSSFMAIGLLLGFFLSLVFRYIDDYRAKNWKVLLKIFGLSLLSGLIGMAAFAVGGCILCAWLPYTHATNIPWYCSLPAYLLFSICASLSLTIKSSVPIKSAMLGGLCSAIIGFIVLYFADIAKVLGMLLNFIIYGGGLGASLVTVRALAEKYFLVIQNGVKAGQRIPIHKWMNATGGGNKVTIGMTGDCEIQMNWEKSNKVAKEHAQLYIDQSRSIPVIKPLANGVVYNTRAELPVGKPSVLTNGDTFKIGDTIFKYEETD